MDEDTFDAFYRRSYQRVVAQVYVSCGNLTEAQECAQEAFTRAWAKRRQFHDDSPEPWVRTVAHRVSIERWRKSRRSVLSEVSPEHPVNDPDSADRITLQRALADLSDESRRVIVLHHLCDLSVADVATELGVPEGTVKARLSRGRAKLAAALGKPDRSEALAGVATLMEEAAMSASDPFGLHELAAPAYRVVPPPAAEIRRRGDVQRRNRVVGVLAGGVATVVLLAAVAVGATGGFQTLPLQFLNKSTPTTVTEPNPGGTGTGAGPGLGWERVPSEEEVSAFEPGDLGEASNQEGWSTDLVPSVCKVDVPALGASSILVRSFAGVGSISEHAVVMEFAQAEDATAARLAIRHAYFNGCAASRPGTDPQFLWTDAVPVADTVGRPGETWAELHRVQWQGADQASSGFEDAIVVQVGNRVTWLVLSLGGFAEHNCTAVNESGTSEVCAIVRQIPAAAARLV